MVVLLPRRLAVEIAILFMFQGLLNPYDWTTTKRLNIA